MNKCKCGHTELAHGEDGKSCLAMLCLCEQFQPCEVEPEPKPIDTGHPYDQSDLDDTKPEPTHRIKLDLIENPYLNYVGLDAEIWQRAARVALVNSRLIYQEQANSQLQAIVKEIFEKLESKVIKAKPADEFFDTVFHAVTLTDIRTLKSEYLGEEK